MTQAHTSTEQPELPKALRLAEMLMSGSAMIPEIDLPEAAAELRRLHARIAELESQLEAIGAGGVEPLRKGFVRLTDVLARLEQGFGANSAPVTTIKRHFEMQAAPAHPAEGVPEQAAEVKIGQLLALARIMVRAALDADNKTEMQEIKAAIDSEVEFERALRNTLAATHPTQQGLDAEYQRGYQDGYNRRDAEVKGALV